SGNGITADSGPGVDPAVIAEIAAAVESAVAGNSSPAVESSPAIDPGLAAEISAAIDSLDSSPAIPSSSGTDDDAAAAEESLATDDEDNTADTGAILGASVGPVPEKA